MLLFTRASWLCIFYLLVGLLASSRLARAQAPTKLWDKTFGGSGEDNLRVLQPTPDGGYLLGGESSSGLNGDKAQASKGATDFWLVKIDAQGNKQWDKTYGGTAAEELFAIQPTSDGGYVLGGSSLSGSSGDKTQPSQGGYDYWVVKIDGQGNKQWDKAFGGASGDQVTALQLTQDGGYLLGGSSRSGISGDKTQRNVGAFDYWIIKLDAQGNKLWDRTFGGTAFDYLYALQPTKDGGYVLGGHSSSGLGEDKTQPNKGEWDYWVVKLDANGTKLWDKTIGGVGYNYLYALQSTSDGGYVLGGASTSGVSGDKTQANKGLIDYWIVKLDANGTKQWDKTFGGTGQDELRAMQLTPDGGYVLGGLSMSGISGDKSQGTQGVGYDYWVIKLDASGTKQWDKTLGGSMGEILYALQPTNDGGYLLGGYSDSGLGGDKTQVGQGGHDYWIVKLSNNLAPTAQISGPTSLCPGGQVVLTAATTPAATTYLWSTGATTPTLPVTQPGTYSVVVTFADGQTRTVQHQVGAFSTTLQITGDSLLVNSRPLALTAATTGATSYLWSTGATTPSISVEQPGTYSVTATYAGGCTRQASYRVRNAPTSTLPDMALPILYIPNVITPNADRLNDRFVVQGLAGQDWTLEVYNRWGRQVYHDVHYRNTWGEQAPAGVYYYVLRPAATTTPYKGWVQVIR
ncbi:gliding motility-associated C-terminal domain-containing protein [Hymenobacter cavernae]|uniref:Gliding motility-associated C-terminal domain-containing protein n=1 Tax=Hymenobacter cavernae TaxID=2044852 RepID=A0ABQ1UVY6_9BACT|nr:gliding motility-associated C-terminal domain-containing protein [Hymenobacter cavernae]GGF28196.1 hypothetical protein GCM10011383_44940 [Hymenobacter cavernae]